MMTVGNWHEFNSMTQICREKPKACWYLLV